MSRTLRRKVFLNENCIHCGCRVNRYLYSEKRSHEMVQELHCTIIEDRCEGTCKTPLRSADVGWPCLRLEGVFDNFRDQMIPRRGLESEIEAVIRQAGGRWESQVS